MDRAAAVRLPPGGSALWTDGVAGELLRAEFFGAALGAGPGGGLFFWNGSAWTPATLKRWDGTAWQVVKVRYWDGAVWQLTKDTPPISVVIDVSFPTGVSTPAGYITSTAGASGDVTIGTAFISGVIEVTFVSTGEVYVSASGEDGGPTEELLATNGLWAAGAFEPSDYEIHFSVRTTSGYPPSGTFGTWQSLSSNHSFSLTTFSSAEAIAVIRVRIRRASDLVELESYDVALNIIAI